MLAASPVVRRLAVAIIGVWLLPGAVLAGQRSAIVTAKAAILINNQTGEVLWERNPDLPLPPASTTKVATAILALQSRRLNEAFWVSPEAAQAPPSKISLRPGWQMELRDLVYAILLNSANDASVVIAEGLAGSVPDFARRMNSLAQRLGAVNTHFVNPNGLPAENHYSTARDLATLFRHALENPEFRQIASTKTTVVAPTEGSQRSIFLRNHNRLLDDYHIRVIGKTGWTRASKKCFVGAGTLDGQELIVAILGSNNLWGDVRALLEFGFGEASAPAPENAPAQVATRSERSSRRSPGTARASTGSSRRYAVRLATFESAARAKRLQESMTKKGYAARVTKVLQNRRTLYRVSVGSYRDRREAQRVADRIVGLQPNLRVIIDAVG